MGGLRLSALPRLADRQCRQAGARGGGRPPADLLEAAAFQWVNPKAWAIIIGALALYTSPAATRSCRSALIAVLFGLVCVPNGVVWCLFGRAIAGFLEDDRRRRWFKSAMAILLVALGIPTLFE